VARNCSTLAAPRSMIFKVAVITNNVILVGSGYFALPNPRLYDIPMSQPVPNRTDHAEQYGTALTHNFHCLVGSLKRILDI